MFVWGTVVCIFCLFIFCVNIIIVFIFCVIIIEKKNKKTSTLSEKRQYNIYPINICNALTSCNNIEDLIEEYGIGHNICMHKTKKKQKTNFSLPLLKPRGCYFWHLHSMTALQDTNQTFDSPMFSGETEVNEFA